MHLEIEAHERQLRLERAAMLASEQTRCAAEKEIADLLRRRELELMLFDQRRSFDAWW